MPSCFVPETGIGPRLACDPAKSFPFCFCTFLSFFLSFFVADPQWYPFFFLDSGLPSAMIVKIRPVLPISLVLLIYAYEAHLHI